MVESNNVSARDIAAALVYFIQQANPLPTNEIDAAKPEAERQYKNNNNRSYNNRNSNSRSKPTITYQRKKPYAGSNSAKRPARNAGATA